MKPYFLPPLILQKLIWVPTRLVLAVFVRLEVRGLENLEGAGPNVIFASNHGSELDPVLIPASLPFWSRLSPVFYVSREKAFYATSGWRQSFYGGLLFRLWGAHPVYAGLKDYSKSLARHLAIVRDGGSPCIFPEGGTSRDGKLRPAKGGVAYLAHETGRPIVPAALSGVFKVSLGDFFGRRRRVRVTFGQPMAVARRPGGIGADECKAEAQKVMGRIGEMLGR